MAALLQPTGTLTIERLTADVMYNMDGAPRVQHSTGVLAMTAPTVIAAAVAVVAPSARHTAEGAIFTALDVGGPVVVAAAEVPAAAATATLICRMSMQPLKS